MYFIDDIIVVLRVNNEVALPRISSSRMNFSTHKQNILGLSGAIRSQVLILDSLLNWEDVLKHKFLLCAFFCRVRYALLVQVEKLLLSHGML